MKHCRTVKLFFGVSLALLSGCASVGPEPRLLADELQYAETVKNLYKADGNWWLRYNDPELNNLIETALANNPDYLKAAFNVEKELAGLGLATADLFPTLSGELSASSQRKIHTGDDFTDSFSGDLGLSYEADLYGKSGVFKRCIDLTVEFKTEQGKTEPYLMLPKEYLNVSQCPNFILEDPGRIAGYLAAYEKNKAALFETTDKMTIIGENFKKRLRAQIGGVK